MSALTTTWRSIWRFHWLLAGILVLEYALAFAIIVSTSAVLISRMHAIHQSSGIDESGLYVLSGLGKNEPVHRFELSHARDAFAALVGRSNVAIASNIPFGGVSHLSIRIRNPNRTMPLPALSADAYQGGVHLLSVLGLRLLHGRNFHANEIATHYGAQSRVVILSRTLGQRLFQGHTAVGKQIEINGAATTVIGVINPLAAPRYLGGERTTETLLMPQLPTTNNMLLIRYAGPTSRLHDVLHGLQNHDRDKVKWSLVPYAHIRADYFQSDELAVQALAAVIGVVLVTAIGGILGLTSYWISRRRRQIAIRRALGATKRDIFRHFFVESSLLLVPGMALGVVLSFAFSMLLDMLHRGVGVLMWVLPAIVLFALATFVVHASLRRWLRMDPMELIRTL